jgi:hypothetical protein
VVAVYRYASDSIQIFVNGTDETAGGTTVTFGASAYTQGSTDGTCLDSISGLMIGAGLYFFNGDIDEVRLYKVALTADEIKQLYRMGAIPKGIK